MPVAALSFTIGSVPLHCLFHGRPSGSQPSFDVGIALSIPLRYGIRFLRNPLPSALSSRLAGRLLPKEGGRIGFFTFHEYDVLLPVKILTGSGEIWSLRPRRKHFAVLFALPFWLWCISFFHHLDDDGTYVSSLALIILALASLVPILKLMGKSLRVLLPARSLLTDTGDKVSHLFT